MPALDSMKAKLKPLGLYSLKNDSTVFYELSAYAEGLSILEDYLYNLENECFIETASSYGIQMRERLFSYSKPSSDISSRRNLLLFMLSVCPSNFTKDDINRAVISSGIDGLVTEQPGNGIIYINCNTMLNNMNSKSEAINLVNKFIPAHLEPIFDFRIISWDYIDTLDNTFNYTDSQDLTWNNIDSYEEE